VAPHREWFEKDYYKVLGVPESATAKDVTKAYRKLARELHPDANPGNPTAEERFKEVSAAYDVLGDEAKRKEYDEVRRLGPMGGGFGGGAPGGGFDPGGFSFNMGTDGLGDLLGGLFGNRGRRGPGGGTRGAGPQRGEDLSATVSLEFADAANGIATTLHLTSDAACSTCQGNGAAPGSAPKVCTNCSGRGVVADNQGLFSFSSPCQVCSGRGVVIDTPCPTCRGTGVERRPREVKVRIPAGVADGQTIRLKDRGSPGRNGGPPGDLLVECRVAPHPLFGRDGQNLTLRVPVTLTEATLGADIDVPTLDGSSVTLRLRPGTQPGSKHRVKGRGVATAKHTGDLIVTTDVLIPTSLTDGQRAALDALAAASTENPRAYLFDVAPKP
jgi:molecular chaperone DnaJ